MLEFKVQKSYPFELEIYFSKFRKYQFSKDNDEYLRYKILFRKKYLTKLFVVGNARNYFEISDAKLFSYQKNKIVQLRIMYLLFSQALDVFYKRIAFFHSVDGKSLEEKKKISSKAEGFYLNF